MKTFKKFIGEAGVEDHLGNEAGINGYTYVKNAEEKISKALELLNEAYEMIGNVSEKIDSFSELQNQIGEVCDAVQEIVGGGAPHGGGVMYGIESDEELSDELEKLRFPDIN